jgi:hypothetical protein
VDSEYRRYLRDQIILNQSADNLTDVRGWYVAGVYEVFKRLEPGAYYSRYTIVSLLRSSIPALAGMSQTDTSLPQNHIYDKVLTVRINLARFWNVKVEEHFMDGYGASTYPDGFYPQVNPMGFKPDTRALVIRSAVFF